MNVTSEINSPPFDSTNCEGGHSEELALASPPTGTPLEIAYHTALDRMIEMVRAAGAAEERERIGAIMILEGARRFPALAWALAKNGGVSREQAEGAFKALETDLVAAAKGEQGALTVH